jgi:hypothetical protein
MPEGNLVITQYQKRYKWYMRINNSNLYLPKSKRSLAEELALKKYLVLRLNDIIQEKKAITLYLKHRSNGSEKSEQLLLNPPYHNLLAPFFNPLSEKQLAWSKAPYTQNSMYPENLIHKSLSLNKVRSKSEVMIDSSLFLNKIPFRYECLLQLDGVYTFPDFTILHPQKDKIYYWEHFGMMDDPLYAKKAYEKLELYASNGIFPFDNLIATFETKDAPLSMDLVEKIIHYYFL